MEQEDTEALLRLQIKELQEENKRLRSFASVVAHDLKNPISTAYAYHEFLKEVSSSTINDEQKSLFDSVSKKLHHSIDMIDSLLAYSMSDVEHTMKTNSLTEIVDRAAFVVSRKLKEREGTLNIEILHDEIFCNDDLMANAIINLIDNAIKYCPVERPPEIAFKAYKEKDKLFITIRDNGKGIPKNKTEDIFVEFERAEAEDHKKGHGIGLSTVKRIIHSHNGKIKAKPMDIGTMFVIKLNVGKQ